jgi:hypothetical protein
MCSTMKRRPTISPCDPGSVADSVAVVSSVLPRFLSLTASFGSARPAFTRSRIIDRSNFPENAQHLKHSFP